MNTICKSHAWTSWAMRDKSLPPETNKHVCSQTHRNSNPYFLILGGIHWLDRILSEYSVMLNRHMTCSPSLGVNLTSREPGCFCCQSALKFRVPNGMHLSPSLGMLPHSLGDWHRLGHSHQAHNGVLGVHLLGRHYC